MRNSFVSCFIACLACTGTVVEPDDRGAMPPVEQTPDRMGTMPVLPVPAGLPGRELAVPIGLRRLTPDEYDSTVHDLLGDTSNRGGNLLPARYIEPKNLPISDDRTPFDDYRDQQSQIGEG